MDFGVLAIIIAGFGVLVSIVGFVYAIIRNKRQDTRAEQHKRRLEKLEIQKHSLEEKKLELEDARNRPKLDIFWGGWYSLNENSGWFNGGKLYIDNISTGSLKFSNWFFSYGKSKVEVTGSVHSLKIDQRKDIKVLFRRPEGIDELKEPPPKFICKVVVENSLGQRYENAYEWAFTKDKNPYLKEISLEKVS